MSKAFSDFFKRHKEAMPNNVIIDEDSSFFVHLSDDMLESVVGGKLNASDIAYCKMTVEFYQSRGYTLEDMQKEVLAYQQSLKSQGKTALAAQSAEYLEYMLTIW